MAEPDEALRARLTDAIRDVRERIEGACARAGRAPEDVVLVAVTKTRTPREILAAHACGLTHLGENRVEELEAKLPELQGKMNDPAPIWHMVGHVQSRKAQRIVETCDVVHSVDGLRLATRLDRFSGEAGRTLPVLIEVNVSHEESKYGLPAWNQETRRALLEELAPLADLAHLEVRGLMTMAPLGAPDAELHRVFGALCALRDELRGQLSYSPWQELSMGMTDDFEVAVEEGATLVRIGRAIFGPGNE